MLFTQFYYGLKNLIKPVPDSIVPLGRWNWKKCNTEMNVYLANIDSCGDKICGNMKETIKFMKFIKK